MNVLAASNSGYDPWRIMPQLMTIIVTTIIMTVFSIIYYCKVKKMKPDDDPRGIVLIMELIIKYIEKFVVDIFGPKYKNLTIYLMYLVLYILIGNWLSIIGLDSQSSMTTVTFSMGLVTFLGIYYIGIRFQKLLFFKKYLINPLELLTQFAPLISISFRLFGNITGGSIITLMLYYLTANIWSKIPIIGQVNLLIPIIAWPLHAYFDLFAGSIQAMIFGILTLVYWRLNMEEPAQKNEREIKLPKKLRKQQQRAITEESYIYNERRLLDESLIK